VSLNTRRKTGDTFLSVERDTYLDDTNGDSLPHVSDGESTKGRVVGVRLDTEGLLRDELDDSSVTRLDELGLLLNGLTSTLELMSMMYRQVESR
jgi:hypothetical protein